MIEGWVPSTITLTGWDEKEWEKYAKLMTPSRGVHKGSSKVIRLLGRKWVVTTMSHNIKEGRMLYKVTLMEILEINK